MDQLIEALTILRKYGNPTSPTWCEHDALHVCISPSNVLEEDKDKLKELGFIPTREDDFQSFRFGSA